MTGLRQGRGMEQSPNLGVRSRWGRGGVPHETYGPGSCRRLVCWTLGEGGREGADERGQLWDQEGNMGTPSWVLGQFLVSWLCPDQVLTPCGRTSLLY